MSSSRTGRYGLFEVVGIELEYVIVDADLRPRCLLEDAFRSLNRRGTSYLERGEVGFSNELAAHVFEIKTLDPRRSLVQAESELVEGLRFFSRVLQDEFDARLLPTGMHPFMAPGETHLWRRAGRDIYETYARIFPIVDHGWLNVQASHVNLPFGSEEESVALHNAVACLLPYLPALSASSPIYEGRIGPAVDNRLEFYKRNQARIPEITGRVVPEGIASFAEYRRKVFRPIFAALEGVPGGERLRHEWVNSRGAIMRFSRRALEIKVLDVQECVRADIAIAVFIRAVLRHLVRRIQDGSLALPPHDLLVDDLNSTIREGSAARVDARHLRSPDLSKRDRTTARSVLGSLLDVAHSEVAGDERGYLDLVEDRVRRGNLSERILHQVRRRSRRRPSVQRDVIREIYDELIDCLEANRPWEG